MQRLKIKKRITYRLYFFTSDVWIYCTSYINGGLTLDELSEYVKDCVNPVDVTIEHVGLFSVEVSGMWEFHTERRKWSKKALRQYLRYNMTAESAVAQFLLLAMDEKRKTGNI